MAKHNQDPILRTIQQTIKGMGYNSVRYHSYVHVPKHVLPCPDTLRSNLKAYELIGAFRLVEMSSCFHVWPI